MSAPIKRDRETVQQRQARVVTMTRDGMSAQQIAVRLGITPRSVTRIRRAAGISKPAARELTPEELAAAKALLEDGASRREVARTIGRSKTPLEKHFPELCWTRAQIDEYRAARRRNWSVIK